MEKTFSRDYPQAKPAEPLKAGDRAPDFALHTTPDQLVRLSEFREGPVILMFYPADWSPVCSDEVVLFNEARSEFAQYKATLLGISVDGVWCHLAFAKDRKLGYPLLSDFEPKGACASSFGVYRRIDGVTERALFLIDSERVVRWSYVSPLGVSPGVDGVLTALEQLAPQNAKPGEIQQKREAVTV